VPLGSAPKPLALSTLVGFDHDGGAAPAIGADFSPNYLAGGGIRTLESYRSNSIGRRLMRVLTKTDGPRRVQFGLLAT